MILALQVARLVPHKGAMCLLAGVVEWDDTHILCTASSHLDPANPLRRNNALSAICGCEYGFQAAALHGALLAGEVAQTAGYVVGLRVSSINCRRLDDPGFGTLRIEAQREFSDANGLIYGFTLSSQAGFVLLTGRGTIKLPVMAVAS